MTLFKDRNGNTSSKRVAAYIAVGIAFLATSIILMFQLGAEYFPLISSWLIFSGGCLGITVAEQQNKLPEINESKEPELPGYSEGEGK